MAQENQPRDPEAPQDERTAQPSAMPSGPGGPADKGPAAFILRGASYNDESFLCKKETSRGEQGKRKDDEQAKVRIEVKAAFSVGMARSGRDLAEHPVAKDDLIEIEFDNGARLWLRADDYYERFGVKTARRAAEDGLLEVPEQLDLLPAGMRARGPIGWAVKSLKVLGVDLPAMAAKELAAAIERRSHERNPKRRSPNLYRCSLKTEAFALEDFTPPAHEDSSPYLLFIHGTGSSTWGSFGDLWSEQRRAELQTLRMTYGDRVLAFEHRSLTESPIANALELAEKLPDNARLHLVTHSRGGLVGELLCRANLLQSTMETADSAAPHQELLPFEPEQFRIFERDERHGKDSPELKRLKKLNQKLSEKRFKIDRFVRVACPALGTTLASERLDRWFSVIGSVAGAALPDTPLFDMFQDLGEFVAAVIKQHTKPQELPGLEAMMPDSACIRLINWPKISVPGDLAVIAGDIEPDAWWAKLLLLIADRFYEGDHDLVVNTPSMYGGAKRSGNAWAALQQGPRVNHFRYFENDQSARQMISALTAKDLGQEEGFEPLHKPTVNIARAIEMRSLGPRPVVFVIPGIMGSELDVGDDNVWLDIPDIMFGGFQQLRIEAKNVLATQPFPRYYGDLIKYLAATHKVVPFPFDWRLKIEQEADRLAVHVRNEYELAKPHGKPVRILAHSMGGLVARAMIARHGGLWNDVCSIDGARLVMLGTPNGGSHAITEMLVAQSATLKQIALIDFKHSKKELLEIICRFPGVLAMLPKDYREDYFSMDTWRNYYQYQKSDDGWVLPSENDINDARRFRQLLDNSPIDPKRMVYVAGHADVTVAEMFLDTSGEKPKIQFLGSIRGDGRVLWDTGIPPEVPTWYVDVAHGDLPAHQPSFKAFAELLSNGKTSLLSQTAPVSRAAGAVLFPLPPTADLLYPDREVLADTVIGARPARRRRAVRREHFIDVRVAHGNLAFAQYPVAVGHYVGDAIVSAERQIDQFLDGMLSQRYRLGIYPESLETSATFFNAAAAPNGSRNLKGAIVVGLGTAGTLTAAGLRRTFTRAMLEYVTEAKERGPRELRGEAAGDECSLGVSALLIGAGMGGIGVKDSVYAILQAIKMANERLDAARDSHRISRLEFIELYEDRALQAAKALNELHEGYFHFGGIVESITGSLRRAAYEEPAGWWRPLQVLGGTQRDGFDDQTLRFSASGRRARAELQILGTQRALVDQFIADAITSTQNSQETACTLYELLLPNELKAQAPEQDNMMLILDEEAARYPWELLQDRLNPSGRPFAVEHGLLRQLESGRPQEFGVSLAQTNKALVIGDPVSGFVELTGAQQEASAVARALQADGQFSADPLIRPNARQVVNALFADSYRILHLAGHGVYQMPAKGAMQCDSCGQALPENEIAKRAKLLKPLTGMIIGDGVVLSPREVHQMRHVPELVFINCCHLGKIEGTSPADAQKQDQLRAYRQFNRIAANVATEFIQMGVRAVIAAGWAVDDGAAQAFAVAFYDRMIQGYSFGAAVLAARKATYDSHPHTNTWGAYQCYGDPDYRLTYDSQEDETKDDRKILSPSDAVAQLDNMTAKFKLMAGENIQREIRKIKKIEEDIEHNKWSENGRVCAALGEAYGEAKEFEKGVHWYEKALAADDAQVRVKDIEQLANLESRLAAEKWKNDNNAAEALQMIDRSIQRMQSLIDGLAMKAARDGGETPALTGERLSILGSAYKRKALISEKDRVTILDKMGRRYKKAFKLKKSKGQFDCYPLLNWIALEVAASWQNEQKKKSFETEQKEILQVWIARTKQELEADLARQKDFWKEAMLVDTELLRVLLENSLDDKMIDQISGKYLEAKKLGSPREFESVVDHLSFLLEMAQPQDSIAAFLGKLLRKLTEEPGRQRNQISTGKC